MLLPKWYIDSKLGDPSAHFIRGKSKNKQKEKSVFKSWSLFLISNPGWLKDSNSKNIKGLHDHFMSFGRAIGKDHVAVWFWKERPKGSKDFSAANIDTKICAQVCKKYNLKISESPHVIITTTSPDEKGKRTPELAVSLNKLTPKSIDKLLSIVADQVVTQQLNQKELDSQTGWIKLGQAFFTGINLIGQVGKHIKIGVKGGPVDVSVGGSD